MRLAVTGGRDHTPSPVELAAFDALWTTLGATTLVHGAARGVDSLIAAHVARTHADAVVEAHTADWNCYGRAAGHLRNAEMLRANVGALIAFTGGRGTANCVEQATRMGIPVYHVPTEE